MALSNEQQYVTLTALEFLPVAFKLCSDAQKVSHYRNYQ